MRKILKTGKSFIISILLLCHFNLSKAQVDEEDPYATLALQKKALIGTWMNTGYNTDEIGDHNWTMKFTKEGKCYWYYPGDEVEVYTYTITNFSPKDPYDYNLNLYSINDLDEHYGYEMYIGRDENNSFDEMSLHSGGLGSGVMTPGNFVFKKISDPSSSKTPSKEEGSLSKDKPKEDEKQPQPSPQKEEKSDTLKKSPFLELTPIPAQTRLEAYQAGYDDCKNRKAWGTSLRNKEYEMDYENGWGKAGCPIR